MGERATARPLIPSRLQPYWWAFLDLNKRRPQGEHGPQPLVYSEIQAYVSLKFRRKEPQIQRLLVFVEALDAAYMNDFFEKQSTSA